MDLADCASYFDDTVVTLPGSSTMLFMAQLQLFADQQRDGLQTERRILSYDPSQTFTLPEDGIVAFAGRQWVLGLSSPDEFQGDVIRAGFVVQMADTGFQIGTAMDWLAATPRGTGQAGMVWDKDNKDTNGTEEVWSQITLYTGASFEAAESEFVKVGNTLYRLRNVYVTSSGMGALEAVELPSDCLAPVQYVASAAFDKVANKPVVSAPVAKPALTMRYYQQSRVIAQAQQKPKDGDLVARVNPADYPALQAGDTFIVSGYDFNVAATRPQADGSHWVHLTR